MDSSGNQKKGKFFYDIVVIQVENTLHRIPRYHLETWSQTFKDMFQAPQGGNAEGSSNEHPIILPGCTNDEFESLLTVLFTAVTPPTLSKGQWISVLKLSTMWVMGQFRELAIDKLSSLGLTPIEKAQLGNTYQVASWILEGCTALIQDAQSVSLDDFGASLGWEMATRILYAGMKLKPQGFLVMGSETWQCSQCSSSGTLTVSGSQKSKNGKKKSSHSFLSEGNPSGRYSLQCSVCSYSGNSIQVALAGSGPDAAPATLAREAFAEELKAIT